jgi:hypothetical protein
MIRLSNLLVVFVTLFLASSLMVSCYTEQGLGKRYVKRVSKEAIPVWFIGASWLYVDCGVAPDSTGQGCIMLNQATDSLLLEEYNKAFANTLAGLGFRIFAFDEAEGFLSQPGGGLVVNIQQLEFEESFDTFTDSEVFDDMEYVETFPVRTIRLHGWVEVSGVDTTARKREVLYADGKASDLIEGYFNKKPFSGAVFYTYRRFDMMPSLTPEFFRGLGEEHASRLFDAWMNRHIRHAVANTNKIGIYIEESGYYTYNQKMRRVEPASTLRMLKRVE